MKDDIKELIKIDKNGMYPILKSFPRQVAEAVEIGKIAPVFNDATSGRVVVLGMGGSAIGGDLLKSYFAAKPRMNHISVDINRNYTFPGNIDASTNILASSYSGNTEETTTALQKAVQLTKNIICITTGGDLKEIAVTNNLPVIDIPSGMMPRCALGYSFFPMLLTLCRSHLPGGNSIIEEINEEITDTLDMLWDKSEKYSNPDEKVNPTIMLARKIYGKVPVIYSSVQRMDAINLRWRCQIQENAKNLAFGSLLPEMNHNEINSWNYPNDLMNRFIVLLIRDPEDFPRTKKRFDAIRNIIQGAGVAVEEVEIDHGSLLSRMFQMIYFGDWVSYWLALMNGVDPTEIPVITKLKNILAGV
jgi:glucose/mannose-6-phosphate isomerase